MTKQYRILVALLGVLGTMASVSPLAFGVTIGVQNTPPPPQSAPAIRYDTVRLPPNVQALITSDLNTLSALQFGPKVDNHFKLLFGGTTAKDIVRYLLERVHYVGVVSVMPDQSQMDPTTYAENFSPYSLPFYFQATVLGNRKAIPQVVDFDHTQVVITSPRVGFIGMGGAYVDPKTTQMDRLDTWVHEARHSDCVRIPSFGDLAMIDRGDYGHVSIGGLSCTYMHYPCPKGHPLAGELACDVVPWGAYSVGFVFSRNVLRACTNCTEKQRQDALASATEDYSRLAPNVRAYLQTQTPPPPDMSSVDAKRVHF
jgi:hypothetical protein